MIADAIDFLVYVWNHWWATVLFVYAFMSVYCFLVYAQDKAAAKSNSWRIPEDYFHNVVVFVGDCEFKTQMPPSVVRLGDLTKYIKSFTTPLIKENQLFEIADAILAWQGTVSKELRAAHVQNLRARHR